MMSVVVENYVMLCWLCGMIMSVVSSGLSVELVLLFIWNIDCVSLCWLFDVI